jgi:hypothetical protein
MGKTEERARDIIRHLTVDRKKVDEVKAFYPDEQDWNRVSSKAYMMYLDEARRQRELDVKKPHVSATPNSTIMEMIELNELLSQYAVGLPVTVTTYELNAIAELAKGLPDTEEKLFERIEPVTMSPNFRARQKNGRFKHYEVFKEFEMVIDAALICFYRRNYISCFLTLAPVIEGVLLRWLRYNPATEKINFENYRSFFKRGSMRNPCPGNVLFYDVFSKLCDNILNKHLYQPTTNGVSYGDFNRHNALHLLKSPEFGTKNNCIRLFMLIDFMTEIYYYEESLTDPRVSLKAQDFDADLVIYANLIIDQKLSQSAEHTLLKKRVHLPK